MRDTHERPVCHRAEDLVTYLYGEASEAETLDFGRHLQQCDACRTEFAGFDQVHASVQLWRNEALGVSLNSAKVVHAAARQSREFVRHERKLSAMAALREFFNVSPLWLRGATAFAALLLLVLGVAMIARNTRKPDTIANVNSDKIYTQKQLEAEVNRAVEQTRQDLTTKPNSSDSTGVTKPDQRPSEKRIELATSQRKTPRPHSLNRQERAQLAADLRLTLPADDDEILLAMPEQEIPY